LTTLTILMEAFGATGIFNQYEVMEELYGIDGMGGPFSAGGMRSIP
jgi:hypothetical protein